MPVRKGLPPLPGRIAKLPIDVRGYPIPWFVAYINGVPDPRVADQAKWIEAVQRSLCWVCGEFLAASYAFVIGPMCAVNRISPEPPSHPECAVFSVKACPFLTTPKEKRREAGMPEDVRMSETAILRNPGVTLVWHTRTYKLTRGAGTEVLFKIGKPIRTEWFREGRAATREEILESINTGLPALRALAESEAENQQLTLAVEKAMALLPAA